MTQAGAPLPLSGVTVLDASQVVAGPLIASTLGDFGARVVKVEQAGVGDQQRYFGQQKDGVSLGWKVLGRNKEPVTLNLREPRGQELFKRLLAELECDVVVESFRPGVMEGWGLGYEALSAIRPGIVMVRVSGFGQDGPYRDRPGFGTLAEAIGGFAHLNGEADGPPMIPNMTLGDGIAALKGVVGALTALYHRDVNDAGEGQVVDVSLFESVFSFCGAQLTLYDQLGVVPHRRGNRGGSSAPRNAYRTRDDKWLVVAAATQATARRVFEAIGRPELMDDPRFATNQARLANVEEVDRIVGEWIGGQSLEDASRVFLEHGAPAVPFLDAKGLMEDAHLQERGSIATVADEELGPIRMAGVQPRLLSTPGVIQHAGLPLGHSNEEIYKSVLGLSDQEIAELGEDGII